VVAAGWRSRSGGRFGAGPGTQHQSRPPGVRSLCNRLRRQQHGQRRPKTQKGRLDAEKRTLTPSASPLHHFGSELRRAREEAGLTLAEFGELVPCDNSTVSRIEAGLIAPDLHLAEVADRTFPFARGWFTRFFSDSANWTENSAFAIEFRDFADDELEATALYTFEHAVLPGLLQTEDYARAVLSRHPGVTNELVNSRVAARVGRQWTWRVCQTSRCR
jgi:transcriptional regulator with XRE-family HTH domain